MRASNTLVVRARLGILAVAAAVVAAVLVPTATATAAPAPTPTPSHHSTLAMGSYHASAYAGQAAHLPSGLTTALKRDLNVSPEQYLADAAAAAQAVKVVASLKSAGVHVLGSKISGTALTVNVSSSADKAAVTAAGATPVVGAPATVDLSKHHFTSDAAPASYGGAGYVFDGTDGGEYRCSIGFDGYSSGGAAQFATAGHCATIIVPNSVYLLSQTAPTPAGTDSNATATVPLGSTVSGEAAYGNATVSGNTVTSYGIDYGIVGSGTQVTPQASIYTWGGGAGNPTSSAPLPIQGQTAGIVGASLCKSGSTSGWTCGTVRAVDAGVEVCEDGITDCPSDTINSIVATTCLLPGDSGGAAVIGNNAAGIDSGSDFASNSCSNPNLGNLNTEHESVFFPIVTTATSQPSLNKSVTGQVGSNWKLLAAPVITSPASGASIAAGASMTGTLFNPQSSAQVALYLDGSSTAFATTSASSGTWSLSLSGVAAGTHTYSLVELVSGLQVGTITGSFGYRPAGSLVKGSAAAVYMVDGAGGLIPISSFSVPSDMGLGTSYTTIPDTEIASLVVRSAPLSNLVSCGGTTYLAGQSKLWSVPSGAIGSLTVQTLPSQLCAVIPKSGTALPTPTFIKGSAATVYELTGGQKDATTSSAQVNALAGTSTPTILTMNDGYVGSIPTGPTLVTGGSLVKTASSPSIYLVDGNGGVIPVASFGTVTDLGLSTSYTTVSDATISAATKYPSPLQNLVSCGGTTYLAAAGKLWAVTSGEIGSLPVQTFPAQLCAALTVSSTALPSAVFIKGSAANIYELTGGQKDAVAAYSQMVQLSAPNAPSWLTLNDVYMASIPTGPTLVTTGSLVKSPSSPNIYLVDGNGGVIPVASFGTVSDLGLSTSYITVSPATITNVSATALNNLVSCGGTTYLAASGKLWAVGSGVIGSLPVETLPSTLCAVLTISTTALPSNVFIKGSAANIYQLTGGKKDTVTAYAQLVQLSAPNAPSWLTLNDTFMASIPTGPSLVTTGSLVKSASSPNIYMVDGNGGLIPVASFGTVTDLGLPTSYSTVSDATITGSTISTTALSNLVSCGGTTYLAVQGTLRQIGSGAYGSLPVETLPSTLCAVLTKSTAAAPSAVFIKGSAANIFELLNGTKDPVTSMAQWQSLAGTSNPTAFTLNDYYMGTIPTGTLPPATS